MVRRDALEVEELEIDVVCSEIELFGKLFEEAQTAYPEAHRWDWFNEALRRLLDFFVASLIEGTKAAAEEAGVQQADDVREHPERLARLRPDAAKAAKALKQLLSREVYRSPAVVERGERSVEKLDAVFAYFMEHPESLPRPYQEQAEQESLQRAVCDYIAGMTDSFLLKRHREIA
jgi:dGTPase